MQPDGREEGGEDIPGQASHPQCVLQPEGLTGRLQAPPAHQPCSPGLRQGGDLFPTQAWRVGNKSQAGQTIRAPRFFLFCSCKAQLKCQEQEFYSISFRIPQSSLFLTAHHSPFLAHVSHTPVENPREVSPALANTKYTFRKLFTLKSI